MYLIRILQTITTFATFAKLAFMRRPVFLEILLLFRRNACPFLESVYDSVDVGALVECQDTEPIAGLATLAEYDGIVPVLGIPSDQDGHLLATPTIPGAGIVVALKLPHHIGRILDVRILVAIGSVEPQGGDCV